jgi:hypothetical protein
MLAVRYSIAHHLHLNDDNKEKASIFVHWHHFSTLGWSNSKQKTMPIATNTAKQWDELLGHKAYFDNVNSFEYIIETTLKGKLSPQQKGLYVEAPIISINKDCTEFELSNANALSDRVKRMMK